MGYYATCDVKGCDEIAQVGSFGAQPKEWLCLHFDETEAVRVRTQQIPPGVDSESIPMPQVRITRNVMMCSKHDMPEFDPEPSSGRQLMVLGEA